MAGTTAMTEAQWLAGICVSIWQRFKERALPLFGTDLALAIAAILAHDLFFSRETRFKARKSTT
jgi:hypothetical protein